jgi:beta-lactamase class A
MRLMIGLLLAILPSAPAYSQSPSTAPATRSAAEQPILDRRMADIGELLRGTMRPDEIFSASFLSAISATQIAALAQQLVTEGGAPTAIRDVSRDNATTARFILVLTRNTVPVRLELDAEGKIASLYFGAPLPLSDSLSAVSSEFARLPGQVSWGLYRLTPGLAPQLISGANGGTHLAIGSGFKLAILGALDREIRAGRMRWTDVVRIEQRSVPTGITQNWPLRSPMTLHSLATLMISISDNTATDVLLNHVGRDRVEAFATANGGLSGPMAFPILSTLEATVLKNPALPDLRNAWLNAPDAEARRAVLAANRSRLITANADIGIYGSTPRDIAQTEWFASSDSMAQLLAWYATSASEESRAIIAINPGITPTSTDNWRYIGYKGGSEPGVISMNLLLRAADGQNYAIAAHWNNPAAAVDEAGFATLINRLAALAQRSEP